MRAPWRWIRDYVRRRTTPDDYEDMYRILRKIIDEIHIKRRTAPFPGTHSSPDGLWVQDRTTGEWRQVGDGLHPEEE